MVLVILFVINFLLYLTTSFSCLMIRWGQRYKKMFSFTIVNVAKFAIQSFSLAVRSAGEMIVCVLKARYSINP